jgi:hypothetical protein
MKIQEEDDDLLAGAASALVIASVIHSAFSRIVIVPSSIFIIIALGILL